jgi:hypothetical protein
MSKYKIKAEPCRFVGSLIYNIYQERSFFGLFTYWRYLDYELDLRSAQAIVRSLEELDALHES